MNGFDVLISQSLGTEIRNKLGNQAIKKIERRLFEKYGLTLTESIWQFQKLDAVLREFFGAGADGLEKSFIQKICTVKTKGKKIDWFSIQDSVIGKKILEAFGEEDKSKILNSTLDVPKIIFDILKETKIPQTSGYRKIKQLIENGLLTPEGFEVQEDGRKVYRYRTVFDNVKINIVKDKVNVDVQMNRSNFNESSILQTIFG